MLQKPEKDLQCEKDTFIPPPIWLLSIISKILEKIIHKRLKTIAAEKKFITHATTLQVLGVNNILAGVENKIYCIAVFLDIEKPSIRSDTKIYYTK